MKITRPPIGCPIAKAYAMKHFNCEEEYAWFKIDKAYADSVKVQRRAAMAMVISGIFIALPLFLAGALFKAFPSAEALARENSNISMQLIFGTPLIGLTLGILGFLWKIFSKKVRFITEFEWYKNRYLREFGEVAPESSPSHANLVVRTWLQLEAKVANIRKIERQRREFFKMYGHKQNGSQGDEELERISLMRMVDLARDVGVLPKEYVKSLHCYDDLFTGRRPEFIATVEWPR